jgi:hypothetical protein
VIKDARLRPRRRNGNDLAFLYRLFSIADVKEQVKRYRTEPGKKCDLRKEDRT